MLAPIGSFDNGLHVSAALGRQEMLVLEFATPQLIRAKALWIGAGKAQTPAQARRLLTPQEQQTAAESGIFTRRPGEAHARIPRQEPAHIR